MVVPGLPSAALRCPQRSSHVGCTTLWFGDPPLLAPILFLGGAVFILQGTGTRERDNGARRFWFEENAGTSHNHR